MVVTMSVGKSGVARVSGGGLALGRRATPDQSALHNSKPTPASASAL